MSFTLTYEIHDRPWTDKWWLVVHDVGELERAYRGEDLGPGTKDTSAYRALVTRFCSECWDMKDWLKRDKTNISPVTRKAAEAAPSTRLR